MTTYSTHAAICAKFYDMTVDSQIAGAFVLKESKAKSGSDVLFVGSMFGIAEYLRDAGLCLTIADFSREMLAVGEQRLPGTAFDCADLRDLPYTDRFDLVIVVGRVFTHMTTDEDLNRALRSCRCALRNSGRLFFDNYEDSKIQLTNYFNGVVRVADGNTEILRQSTTESVSQSPFVVRWNASYKGSHTGVPFAFEDSILQRAWSRSEIRQFLGRNGFEVVKQGDNFDDTSFFTLVEVAD